MAMKLKLMPAAAVLAVLAIPVDAADAPLPECLSLRQCIQIALQKQAEVLVARNNLTGAQARKNQAVSSYYPQVSIEHATYLAQSTTSGTPQQEGGSFVVFQDFYNSGLREAQSRQARAQVTESSMSLNRTGQDVIFSVTRDYFEVLRAVRLAEVREAQVTYLEGQIKLVRSLAEHGDAAEVDALPIEAQLANSRVDLIEAQNGVNIAAVAVQNTMGLFPRKGFSVSDFDPPPLPDPEPVNTYIATAFVYRPEVVQTQAAIRATESALDVTEIEYRPRLEVTGSYQKRLYGKNIWSSFGAGWDDEARVSANIVWDIYDGNANKARIVEARSTVDSAKVRADRAKQDIQAQVEQAYLDLDSARRRIQASQLSLESSRKNFEVQEERYAQGFAIALDLLNAQSELVTAESSAVQARYDYYTAIAQLNYAVGKQGVLYEEAG